MANPFSLVKEWKIAMSTISYLEERWKTAEGRKLSEEIFSQRFSLKSLEHKLETCRRNDLIVDLRAIDLSHKHLHDFLLVDVDAQWANMSSCQITGPFQDIDLSHARFDSSMLLDCRFMNANVQYCSFSNTHLKDTMIEYSDFKYSSFKNTHLDQTKFYHSDLRFVDIYSATFSSCILYQVTLDSRQRDFWLSLSEDQCTLQRIKWL